jgi:hypothetical protein
MVLASGRVEVMTEQAQRYTLKSSLLNGIGNGQESRVVTTEWHTDR